MRTGALGTKKHGTKKRVALFSVVAVTCVWCFCLFTNTCMVAATNSTNNSTNSTANSNSTGTINRENRTYVLKWVATGPTFHGWAVNQGFLQLLVQAGLITAEGTELDGVTASSGGGWLALQLFFSNIFYTMAVTQTSSDLKTSVDRMLQAYADSLPASVTADSRCLNLTSDSFYESNSLQFLPVWCHAMATVQWDWGVWVQNAFKAITASYAESSNWTFSRAGNTDRVLQLRQTSLNLVASLSPSSRQGKKGLGYDSSLQQPGELVYLGISQDQSEAFTTVLPTTYAMEERFATGTKIVYGTKGEAVPLTATAPAPQGSFSAFNSHGTLAYDWTPFYLYRDRTSVNAKDVTTVSNSSKVVGGEKLAIPFNDQVPKINQLAAMTSAIAGIFSPETASSFIQHLSVYGDTSGNTNLKSLIESIWDRPIVSDWAVCTQWPSTCSNVDGRFLDGSYVDPLGIATAVGQYHRTIGAVPESEQDAAMGKTLKLIVSHAYDYSDGGWKVLSYFNNPDNEGVQPGDYHWNGANQALPFRSPQIFRETLTSDDLKSKNTLTVPGVFLSTTLLTGTTVENEAFGTMTNQKVEILLLNSASPVPDLLVSQAQVLQYKGTLADLAYNISTSPDLLRRIKTFVHGPPTAAVTSSAHHRMRSSTYFGTLSFSISVFLLTVAARLS